MKSFYKELWYNVAKRMDFINITSDIEQALKESQIKEGLCLVNAMHITASVLLMMMSQDFIMTINHG